jgi:guanosine-3',5'-bis(diphosphate) 3'-pyrophosphohydrolase
MTIDKTTKESDLKLLLKPLDFATRKHTDQRRKDKEASPYINHATILYLKAVQSMLGHSSLEVTGRHYAHLDLDAQRAATERHARRVFPVNLTKEVRDGI